MAIMINCRECEKKVSERAKYCPHCGAPTMHPIRVFIIELCMGIAILFFPISYVILFFMHLD